MRSLYLFPSVIKLSAALLFTLHSIWAMGQPDSVLINKIKAIKKTLNVEIVFDCEVEDSWKSVTYETKVERGALLRYLSLLLMEYSKYPDGYLNKVNVTTLVLGNNLKLSGQSRAAIPDPYKKQMFLSVNGAYGIASTRYLAHVMHHELHHCMEYTLWKSMTYDWNEWILLNGDGFCYGNGGASAYTEYISKGTDFYSPINPKKGFVNLYSITGDEEDRAELVAFMMTDTERPLLMGLYKKDVIIKKKADMVLKLLSDFTRQAIKLPDLNTELSDP